jgi:ATP-dependent helicase HrpA
VESARGPGWESLLEDMRGQLAELVTGTFLIDTPWPWLIQFPRYFQALRQRLTRLGSGGLKTELALQSELGPWRDRWKMFQSGATAAQRVDPVVLHTRWLLEEFRVQLFAQKLGTAVPVSAARLDEHFLRLR